MKNRKPEEKTPNNTMKVGFFLALSTKKEKGSFIENLAMLLTSGIDLVSAFDTIATETRSAGMKKVVNFMKEEIEGGSSLSNAMDASRIFSPHIISLVQLGEQSGKLIENLNAIVTQQQKEQALKAKISSAMMYPVFVLGLMVVVSIGIAWFILPRLSSVFKSVNKKLPIVTRILIETGNFLGEYGYIVIPALLIAMTLLVYFVFIYRRTKFVGQFIFLNTPIIKRLVQEVEISKFGYILGNLMSAGLPVVTSLRSLADITSINRYKRFYSFLADKVSEGNSFHKSFTTYKNTSQIFPLQVQQILFASEKSGRLSESLVNIGEKYEEKTESTSKNLTTLLEPLLLVIVWFGVGTVALAVILPIYSLVGNLGDTPDTQPPAAKTRVVKTADPSVEVPESTESSATEDGVEVLLTGDDIVEILPTGVDYLNVRKEPSTGAEILTRVKPGERYKYLEEITGWTRIELPENGSGWVSANYVRKSDQD
ncbi:hypothetical protein A2976_02230 [candidate division WWE3 bacterium RIFCSPLOWO2_01_FULL_41_9]|uniref:SH3b domain-containing protein n=5 Tax=Katanobacteria TaxID=422282 RepID=A0A1F4VKT0_UNCKA|nr:MAG: hypothetical protein A2976_02230 [candidate division WWE3 bacterium RIFCSPLOWO2_01_FULL_41_9]